MRRCVLVLLCVVACSVSAAPPEISCPILDPCRFAGLGSELASGRLVKILIVHGMGPAPQDFSEVLIRNLSKKLVLSENGPPKRIAIPHLSYPHPPSNLTIRSFRHSGGAIVEMYSLQWSPVITDLKTTRLGYDASEEEKNRRVSINHSLKTGLMNQRLADPVLYLGPLGDEMRYPIRQALCWMTNGKATNGVCDFATTSPDGASIAIVTFSLGSRMTFDAIAEVERSAPDSGRRAMKSLALNTRLFFMLANQLPLLDLGISVPRPGGLASPPQEGLSSFLHLRANAGGLPSLLPIIAVSDPNDLLSYAISAEFARRHSAASFINVRTRIARPWFGRLANPLKAHTGHDENPSVIELMANGHR